MVTIHSRGESIEERRQRGPISWFEKSRPVLFGFNEDSLGHNSSSTSVFGQNKLPGSGVLRGRGDLCIPKHGEAINGVAVRLAGDAGESRQLAEPRLFKVHKR